MKLITLALLVASAGAATVLVTNSAMSGGTKSGWNTTVWSVDTATGSSQMVADTFADRPAWAGVVCNNVYYSVWAEPPNYGLRMLDLASGKSSDLTTSSLFHVLACDPKDASKLLGTASDFTATYGIEQAYKLRNAHPRTSRDDGVVGVGDAPFHLKSYDPATQTEAVVGTFPAKDVKYAGYDGIFSFTQDGSQVWAAWPADECPGCSDAKKGGHVHVMDTSSGQVTSDADVKFGGLLAKKGSPYFLLPDAKRGVFSMGTGTLLDLKWADLTIADNSISAKVGNTDASMLWDSSAPVQMCGSNLIAGSRGTQTFGAGSVYEISPADATTVNTVDLTALDIEGQDTLNIGALACAKPSAERAFRFRSIAKGALDTCTGPHESCCPAPQDDVNNCPASSRTSDCDAKKSCCCG